MRKQQGVRRLGPGKYQVTVVRTHPTERRPDGRPLKVKRKRIVNGSRKDAEREHAQLAEELETELGLRAPPPPRVTLLDYAQQWIELRARKLKRSTMVKYVKDLEKYILPVLGGRKLDEIRPSDIRAMLAKDPGAPICQKNRVRLLSAIAKDALADGLIERDFCLRVSVKVPPAYSEEQPNSLTPVQLAQLLAHFDDEWIDAAHLMAFTGMRWCEVAGLQWADIDLEAGVLRIRRANVKGYIGEPKTDTSRRTLALPWEVVYRLRDRYRAMVKARHPGLAAGWVFPKADGGMHRGYPLAKPLQRACKAAGIGIRFTQHGLRRTWNDLARRHVDGAVVRSIMGHSEKGGEAMTDHYSSVRLADKRAGLETVVQVVQAAREEAISGPEGLAEGAEAGPAGAEVGTEAEAPEGGPEAEIGADPAEGTDPIVDGGDPKGDPSR